MSGNTCHCGKPAPNAFLCQACATTLAKDLTECADHLRHLDDKRARRGSRLWIGRGTPSSETPLPFDARVRDVAMPARNLLTTWARVVIEEHRCRELPNARDTKRADRLRVEIRAWDKLAADIEAGAVVVTGDGRGLQTMRESLRIDLSEAILSADLTNLADVAAWLARHTAWISGRDWAEEFSSEVTTLREELDRLMDVPPDRVALGECGHDGCTEILAAEAGKTKALCPRCGWDHDVQERRIELLNKADDLVVSVKEAVRLLRMAGHDSDARTVYAAIRHLGIRPALTTRVPGVAKPVSVYRLGVLREAVEAIASDPETRRGVDRAKRGAA